MALAISFSANATHRASHTTSPPQASAIQALGYISDRFSADATQPSEARHEIVFIDTAVTDWPMLANTVKPGMRVITLDAAQNGLAQMAKSLTRYHHNLDAIHLISHGRSGALQAGSLWLSVDNLDAHAATLEQIGAALSPQGELLLYACNVAQGTRGETFIRQLAAATQVPIGASTNGTGDSAQGGDWVLEAHTRSELSFSTASALAVENYPHLLSTLQQGDLAVTGWSALTDTVALVTLVDISSGTVIVMADKGWDQGTNAFTTSATGDGTITWTTSSSISKGTVLSLFLGGSDQTTTLTNITTNTDLSIDISVSTYTVTDPILTSGDGLFIYQDSAANPFFIFGFNNSAGTVDASNWNTSIGATLRDSMLPNGAGSQNALTNGVNAVGMPGSGSQQDNVQYTGPTSSVDAATWLARMTNVANWNGDNTGTTTSSISTTPGSSISVFSNSPPTVTTSGGTSAFTEGNNVTSTPVVVDSGITVSDTDNATLASATVSITGNFQNGQDVLAFTNNGSTMGNISASYTSSSGVLTMTSSGATATLAQWQAALRAVTYTNSSNTPSTSNRTLSFVVNDGIVNSSTATKTISVTSVNDTPIVTTSGGTVSFAGSAIAVDSAATLSDLDNTTFASATVSITGNLQTSEDVLAFTNTSPITYGNISANYTSINGVLTLTSSGATATTAQWQAALRTVTYNDTATPRNNSARTISFVVNDGTNNSSAATKSLLDGVLPSIASTTVPANATYVTRQNLDFTVTYSEPVTINNSAFIQLTLNTGGTVHANYLSGSGGTTITFRYTVVWGNLDSDGIGVIGSIIGTVADAAGNNPTSNDVTFASTASVQVSAVVTATGPANATYIAGQNLDFVVTYPISVTVNNSAFIQLVLNTGGTVHANYLSGSGSTAITFRYTVVSGNLDSDGIGVIASIIGTVTDGFGDTPPNPSFASTAGVLIDAVAPSIASATVPANGPYRAGQALDFTVTYSEVVTVNTSGGTPSLALTLDTGGTVSAAYLSGSSTTTLTFRYSVASGNTDTDGISVASSINLNGGTLRDAVSNNAATTSIPFASTSSVLVDTTAPTVLSINRQDPLSATTNATPVVWRVTFSESVNGINDFDFYLFAPSPSTASGSIQSVSAASGSIIDVTVRFISGDGLLELGLNNSPGIGVTDAAGNALVNFNISNGQFYTIDNTATSAPTSFTAAATGSTVTLNWINPVNSDFASVTIRRSPDNYPTSITDGASVFVSSSNSTTDSSLDDGTYYYAIFALDTVGNVSSSAIADATVDITAPAEPTDFTATPNSSTINLSWTNPTSDFASVVVRRSSSEYPTISTGTVVSSPNYSGSSLSNTGLEDGTYYYAVFAYDAAGNASSGAIASATIDTIAPAISSVSSDTADGTYKIGDSIAVTVTFNETVTVTGTPTLTLNSGGTASYTSGSGSTTLAFSYTVGTGDSAADLDYSAIDSLSLAGGTIQDAASNNTILTLASPGQAGSLGNAKDIVVDGIAPAVSSISRASANPTHASSVDFTVTFSESVTGVGTSDFTTTGTATGTIASLTGSGTTYTVTVNSISGSGTLGLDLNASGTGITDSASNAINGGFTGQTYTITALPDLTLANTHVGHYILGTAGGAYSLTVSNSGGPASGTVTLTATLPTGLTAGDIDNATAGWTCVNNAPTVTCTRSDGLAGSASYPAISLIVDVGTTAPDPSTDEVTMSATVSVNEETNTGNNTTSDTAIVSIFIGDFDGP